MRFGKIFISGGFILCLTALYFFEGSDFLLIVLLAIAFHEAGHLLAISLLGGKVSEIRLESIGAIILYEGSRMSYIAELFAALSGPVFSLGFAFLTSVLGKTLGEFWFTLAGVNLTFAFFNILPASILDGGRILYMTTAHFLNIETAEKISFAVSCAVSLGILLLGFWLLLRTGWNFTLLASGILLFISTAIVKRSVWV